MNATQFLSLNLTFFSVGFFQCIYILDIYIYIYIYMYIYMHDVKMKTAVNVSREDIHGGACHSQLFTFRILQRWLMH